MYSFEIAFGLRIGTDQVIRGACGCNVRDLKLPVGHLIFWENFESLFWTSGKRVPLSVTPIMEYANDYLRVKVLKFTGEISLNILADFSYERIITPLEGLKVLKQLKNEMKLI